MPGTGGVFEVDIAYDIAYIAILEIDLPITKQDGAGTREGEDGAGEKEVRTARLWDRKLEGGFPGQLSHFLK